jgi:phage shock protein C
MIGGVAGGIAIYFDIDPTLVRLIWVVLTIATGGLAALAYLLLWIIVPLEGQDAPSHETVRSNVAEMTEQARSFASAAQEAVRGSPPPQPSPARGEGEFGTPSSAEGEGTSPSPQPPSQAEGGLSPAGGGGENATGYRRRGGQWAGIILVALGVLFMVENLGWFWWWRWNIFWPVVLIAIGVALLANRAWQR